MGFWDPAWCEPCILTRFSPRDHGLWELLFKVMSPIAAGMSVIFDIDVKKLEFLLRYVVELPTEDWGLVYDDLHVMKGVYDKNQKNAGFDERDVKQILEWSGGRRRSSVS